MLDSVDYSFHQSWEFGAIIFQFVFCIHFWNSACLLGHLLLSHRSVMLSSILFLFNPSFCFITDTFFYSVFIFTNLFFWNVFSAYNPIQCIFLILEIVAFIFFFFVSFIPLLFMLVVSILKVLVWILGLLGLFLLIDLYLVHGLYIPAFIYA